ncbi:MAG: DUF4843 domain-containing protein [Prevotella sp.]
MKKIIFLAYAAAVMAMAGMTTACTENDHPLYEEKPRAYFSSLTDADSISYSFASGAKEEDVVNIPLRIIGESTDTDRKVAIEVSPLSTAIEGVHYSDLTKEVTVKAGDVTADVTLKVYDKQLEDGDVTLLLNILSNDDFDKGYGDRLTAKLVITNQLVMPSYWKIPLSLYYGAYSKAKHQLCIQIQGFDFPATLDYNMISDYMSYGRMVYNYLLKTPIWDEDTQTWITADWSPL